MANLNTVFAALADPTRRALLERLSTGEATVGELSTPFSISPPAVSRHLKILEAAGLIARTRAGQYVRLRMQPEAFAPASAWLRRHNDAAGDARDQHAPASGAHRSGNDQHAIDRIR